MKFNKLDLNLLVALDILLKEQSVSRAAELMHLSPSALSNHWRGCATTSMAHC